MKATLEFNLDNPDDLKAHMRCVKSLDMACALFEIVYNAHRHVDGFDTYRQKILEATEDININELID